mmetsp:Transcript_94926/g.203897  ORF Transcript_94926/g.203897 Transcript_94926/m.203897 type:complete len:296 (-) Transcript_94926:52-939(-)
MEAFIGFSAFLAIITVTRYANSDGSDSVGETTHQMEGEEQPPHNFGTIDPASSNHSTDHDAYVETDEGVEDEPSRCTRTHRGRTGLRPQVPVGEEEAVVLDEHHEPDPADHKLVLVLLRNYLRIVLLEDDLVSQAGHADAVWKVEDELTDPDSCNPVAETSVESSTCLAIITETDYTNSNGRDCVGETPQQMGEEEEPPHSFGIIDPGSKHHPSDHHCYPKTNKGVEAKPERCIRAHRGRTDLRPQIPIGNEEAVVLDHHEEPDPGDHKLVIYTKDTRCHDDLSPCSTGSVETML